MRYRDRRGRVWSLALDVGGALRLRDLLGVDILAGSGEWGERLATDDELAVDCMYAIAMPQCDERGVTDWSFGRGLKGRVFLDAYAAMAEGINAFYPPPRDRDEDEGPTEADEEDAWASLFKLAGYVGVDPRPLTLGELLWMAEGRQEHESRVIWSPMSALIAKLNNVNCSKESDMKDADHYNPWSKPAEAVDLKQPRRRSMLR